MLNSSPGVGNTDVDEPDRAPVSGSAIVFDAEPSKPSDGFWTAFGLLPIDGGAQHVLPPDVITFTSDNAEGRSALTLFLKTKELPPRMVMKVGGRDYIMFHLADPAFAEALARSVPDGVGCIVPGGMVDLPNDAAYKDRDDQARSVVDLSELTGVEVSRVAKAHPGSVLPAVVKNPLLGHTLLGQSSVYRARAVEAKPLLADLCMSGQVTTWYAAPNTGKTLIALNLIVEAIRKKLIAPGNIFYINADDSSEGLATKMEMMDEVGVHTIVPNERGFKTAEFVGKLREMAVNDQARGVLIVVDTAKKFAQLMDKKDSSAFGDACRQVAMTGGAVLNLAHTTKSPNADGSPRYTATTDLVEDADAAYTIQRLDTSGDAGERVVEFRCFRRRGDNAECVAYAYAAENGLTYQDRMALVHPVDADTLNEFKRVEAQRADEDVLQVIATCITEGINVKMLLGAEAAARANVSRRAANRLIEQYTGDDPAQHRWKFTIKARGAKTYELLPPPG